MGILFFVIALLYLFLSCTQETQHEVNEYEFSSGWPAGGSFRKALCLLDWEEEN